jgi:hypothetical protein
MSVYTKQVNTIAFIVLRIYMVTFGRLKAFSCLLKKFLRRLMVMHCRASQIEFERSVTLNEKVIIVNDILRGLNGKQLVYLGGNFSYAFGPSTATFREEQLSAKVFCFRQSDLRSGELCVERHFLWNGKLDTFKVHNLERATN